MNFNPTRRMFAMRFASVLSALGIASAVLPSSGIAQTSATSDANGIRKLNSDGKPGSEITHVVNDQGGRVHANSPAQAMRQTLSEFPASPASR